MFRLIFFLFKVTFIFLFILIVLLIPLGFYAVRGVPSLSQAKAFSLCVYSLKDNYQSDWNYYTSLITNHRSNHPIELNKEVSLFPLPPMTVLISSENNRYKTCQSKETMQEFYSSLKAQGYKQVTTLDGRKSFERGNFKVSMSFKNKDNTNYGIYTLGHSILMIGDNN